MKIINSSANPTSLGCPAFYCICSTSSASVHNMTTLIQTEEQTSQKQNI